MACILASVSAACTDFTWPLPAGNEQYDPPPVYAAWWKMVEECSGRSGSLAAVEWYVVPGARTIPDGSYGDVAGYTVLADNRIVLAGEYQMVGGAVRHEMLHALRHADGHPRRDFLERCGGVVDCVGQCIDAAGPPPTPATGTPLVPADSFDVAIEIRPVAPGSDTLGGYFMAIVTAKNRANHPVILMGPPPPYPLPATTFGYIFGASGPGLGFFDYAWDSEAASFNAGETKQEVFDFEVGGKPGALSSVAPGTYQLRGGFGANLTAPVTFVVSP